MNDDGERKVYLVCEIADMMGVSVATVYAGLSKGQIPARRVGSRWIISRTGFNYWFGEYPSGEDDSDNVVDC